MTDDDLLTILQDDFEGTKAVELLDRLDNERKVEQPGKAPQRPQSSRRPARRRSVTAVGLRPTAPRSRQEARGESRPAALP